MVDLILGLLLLYNNNTSKLKLHIQIQKMLLQIIIIEMNMMIERVRKIMPMTKMTSQTKKNGRLSITITHKTINKIIIIIM